MNHREERYNSMRNSRRHDRFVITIVAALFITCSVSIFVTKYSDQITSMFSWGLGAADNRAGGSQSDIVSAISSGEDTEDTENSTEEKTDTTEQSKDNSDLESTDTEAATEEGSTKDDKTVDKTEEPDTKEDTHGKGDENTGEEPNTEQGDIQGGISPTGVSAYVDTKNPDLSLKGDDWYNDELFIPGSVTDDAYFDTALLIGDSRTEGLSMYTGLSNLDAFCSKGLTIEKVMTDAVVPGDGYYITVLDALELKTYDNIYISFGINELGWAYEYLFIESFQTFIDAVRELQPDAVIYVENILPVSKELSDTDDVFTNDRVNAFNDMLKDMCMDYGDIIYLDVASSVEEDGVLPAGASEDGIHCNVDYCSKWLDYIRNNVYVKR